jgi:DNA-binding Xre family transcriptional regulator
MDREGGCSVPNGLAVLPLQVVPLAKAIQPVATQCRAVAIFITFDFYNADVISPILMSGSIATFASSPSTRAARSTKMPKMKRKPLGELSKEVRKRPSAAAEIDARKNAIVAAVRLAELRTQIGKTQTELAQVLGMTQANISRIEHTENLYLRTLADYVSALGGHIEVNAVFDDDVVPLGLVEKDRDSLAA